MKSVFDKTNKYEIGVDEVGRGPLFGRVYTAAVVLPKDLDSSEIKDSKRFTSEKKLKRVYNYIKDYALYYSIDYVNEGLIDKINIREATFLSMKKSINHILTMMKYDFSSKIAILIDGNDFSGMHYYHNHQIRSVPTHLVKKGDALYYSIAAASILAKVARDEYIYSLCKENIELDNCYHLSKNKGYGTKQHRDGIKEYGLSKYHRKSFKIK